MKNRLDDTRKYYIRKKLKRSHVDIPMHLKKNEDLRLLQQVNRNRAKIRLSEGEKF